MNPTSKKRAVQGDKELLRKLLNAKTHSKLLVDNRFRKWAVDYGDTQDKCESEKIDRYLIIAKKQKRRKLRYDNKNYVKSLINKQLDYHKLGSETLPEWTVPPDNRNFMKSCINEHLGLHRKVSQRERKWEVPHNNVNYISKYVNEHLGEHQHIPEEDKQWIINPDNKNFVMSFVNEQHGMHRTIPQKKNQWNVTNDNKNYIAYFVNKHKGMHRHDGAPEPEWDVYHNNQSYVKSLVNQHVGMHREVPETVEKWHVIQGSNQNYLKSYVNEHHGWHRLIDEETDRWQVGPDNRNFIKRYVNDHVGFHRQVPDTERLWEIPPNNKNYIMSSVNDHKGVHRDAPSLEQQWNVDSDNKNFIKSCVNENIGMHALKEEDLQKWKVHYNNSNYVKSTINEYLGKHRDETVQAKHWPIEYDNGNFMKATVNSHLGNHRDVASQEWQWKVSYGNRNYIRSCINDHQNLHVDMPDTKRDWEIKGDNKNFIKSYINEDAGEHWRAQDPEKKWNITSDNKNYIKSYVNKHRGMHRIPSDLLVIEGEEDEGSMSDTNSVKIAKGNPKLTEIKYKKNVKIVKADMDDLELEGGTKNPEGGKYSGRRWQAAVAQNQNFANALIREREYSKWKPTREIRVNDPGHKWHPVAHTPENSEHEHSECRHRRETIVHPHELGHTNEYQFGLGFEQEDVPHQNEARRVSQGGFRFHDVVRNYFDFDNDWVDLHPSDYTEDSLHYAEVEESTPPEPQQLYGSEFKQEDKPHATKDLRRISTGGFRFYGTVRNPYDYKDPDWVLDTKEEDFDAAPDAASGCAFKQEDVPHVPLMRKVSTGGFRFYGVVRNIYDYDIDEKDLSASLKVLSVLHFSFMRVGWNMDEMQLLLQDLNPESYRRSKSRDYRKPGTIQSGFDTEDFAKQSLTVPEAKDTARIKSKKQIVMAEQIVEPQKPILSKHTEDTLSYFRENASKNAPSKWQKVAPQPQRPSASNFKDRAEQFKRNTALESSRPGVADALLYFNQKVTPVHKKKTTNVTDTLSYFHHKVAPDRPTMEVAPQIRKPEISSRVQDTLSQYQKEAFPKKKPTMPMSIQPQHREELQETTITTDSVSKRIKPKTVGQNDNNFVTFMAEMDEHLSHPNDHGIKHHRRYEEFSNDHGSEIYMKTDEKYMEINHPGGTT